MELVIKLVGEWLFVVILSVIIIILVLVSLKRSHILLPPKANPRKSLHFLYLQHVKSVMHATLWLQQPQLTIVCILCRGRTLSTADMLKVSLLVSD